MRGNVAVSGAAAAQPLLSFSFPGEPLEVRHALARVMAALEPLELPDACRCSTELVLAEVLNNVVEHAYATTPGPIMLELRQCDGALHCTVRDRGQPMPDGTPPSGRRALVDVPLEDLPEGGFGWFLIRSMTRQLDYFREIGGNRLVFVLPLDGSVAPG